MTVKLGYHPTVRAPISASVALFSLLALPAILVSSSSAQINGAPASVTSPGFGGHAINGARPSVTSLGPNGYAPGPVFTTGFPFDGRRGDGRGEHHRSGAYTPPLYYAYPVPYAVDLGPNQDQPAEGEAEAQDQEPYQGGPTVFDRRGMGAASYIPPVHNLAPPHQQEHAEAGPAPAPENLEPTTLIFKDGHKLEVSNYAIIGSTLFDMTPGHTRKVPLSSLDLEATRRQNDEHGVTFELPNSSQAN